jgi:hypothetical protein
MPTATGPIKIVATSVGTTLVIKGPPDVTFEHPLEPWVLRAVEGNAGVPAEVDYSQEPGPPPGPKVVLAVRVG